MTSQVVTHSFKRGDTVKVTDAALKEMHDRVASRSRWAIAGGVWYTERVAAHAGQVATVIDIYAVNGLDIKFQDGTVLAIRAGWVESAQ